MAQQVEDEKTSSSEVQTDGKKYLCDIIVDYRDCEANFDDYITELNKENCDLNKGCGGKFIYLKGVWTDDPSKAITGIEFVQSKDELKQTPNLRGDLAKGAGGNYRYLHLHYGGKNGITSINLYRTGNKNDEPCKYGYELYTDDINKGRKSSYLFLCWKVTELNEQIIESIEYELNKTEIVSKAPMVITTEEIDNTKSTIEQSFSFSVSKSVTHSSNFSFSSSASIAIGTKFKAGIPMVAGAETNINISASQSFTTGKSNSITKSYNATFPLKAPAGKKVRASAVVKKLDMEVPFQAKIKTVRTGKVTVVSGVWKGVSTFNLSYKIETL